MNRLRQIRNFYKICADTLLETQFYAFAAEAKSEAEMFEPDNSNSTPEKKAPRWVMIAVAAAVKKNTVPGLWETEALFSSYDGTLTVDERINTVLYGPYFTAATFCAGQKTFSRSGWYWRTAAIRFVPKINRREKKRL